MVSAGDPPNYARKLGIQKDQVVQELGWDEDTDDEIRAAVEEACGSELLDEDTEEEKTYQIVGDDEADIKQNMISVNSPIARALIGKDEGDSVEVTTPGGQKSYEILSIRYE